MSRTLQINGLLLFLVVLIPGVKSQSTIGSEQFFEQAISMIPQLQTSVLNEERDVNFPWIEEYEFRTETRDFDPEDQEYTLRLSPSTPRIRRAQKALYKHYLNTPKFENRELICDALLDANVDWTSLFLIERNIELLIQLAIIYDDKDKVFQKMMSSSEIPIEKIIDLESDRTDLKFALQELKIEKQKILIKYNFNDVFLDFADFINVGGIASRVRENLVASNFSSLEEIAYEQEEVKKEIDLELAEKRQIFDFAQVRYEGPHTDFLNERLSLSVGLRIPNSGNRKLRIKELEFRQEDLIQESKRERFEIENRFEQIMFDLKLNIEKWQVFTSLMSDEETKLSSWKSRISGSADFTPLILLEIEERKIEMELKQLEIVEDVLDDYLRYLNQSGVFCNGQYDSFLRE